MAGVYVYCAVCHPNNFNNSKSPTKLLGNFQVFDAKNEESLYSHRFPAEPVDVAVEVGGALQLGGHVHHGPRPRVRVLEVRAAQTWHGVV